MLNRISIMGRLTRDPELRSTSSGISVTRFTLAVDRDYKDQSGERQADFIDCVAWRATADFVKKYFVKGRMAVVTGSLQSQKWQDKHGVNRTSWEVVAESVYFGDSKREEGAAPQSQYSQYSAAPQAAYQPSLSDFPEVNIPEEDLPF